jgi:predicted RNA-binding protein with PUA-like domain
VDVEAVRPLLRPVTLTEMKANPLLAKMAMIRRPRLSVSPVTEEEFATILELAKTPA